MRTITTIGLISRSRSFEIGPNSLPALRQGDFRLAFLFPAPRHLMPNTGHFQV
jgi:hypothetical protein